MRTYPDCRSAPCLLLWAKERSSTTPHREALHACAGSDYSQSSIDLARAVAERRGMDCVQWRVDDVVHTGLTERCASLMHPFPDLRALWPADGVPLCALPDSGPNPAMAQVNRWHWSSAFIVHGCAGTM